MCLMCSLRQCGITLEFIRVKKIQTRFHGRGKNEASHYCHDCDVSYFYLLILKIKTTLLFTRTNIAFFSKSYLF